MLKYLLIALVIWVLVGSCHDTENRVSQEEKALWELASTYLKPLEPVPDSISSLDRKRTALGELLFFDVNLSFNRNISCNSCHRLDLHGVDQLPVSRGTDGEFLARNTPTVLNASEQYAQFWDARAQTLQEQLVGPLFNEHEMGLKSEKMLLDRLKENPDYQQAFEECFPGDSKPMGLTNMSMAISMFEQQLLTPTRFDAYLNGNLEALSLEEKQGLRLFIESGCIPCHGGRTVGGQLAQKFPLYGRMSDYFDLEDAGQLVLKVPSLRNVTKTAPYFHNGKVESLEEAIAMMAKAQTNSQLDRSEVAAIAVFLGTLTAKKSPDLVEDKRRDFL